MGDRGPLRELPEELAFDYWYNQGERRTLTATAEYFGVHLNTISKYANEHDWRARADDIDAKAKADLDRRLASTVAKTRAAEIEAMRAIVAKFTRRLAPTLQDGRPNPDELRVSDITLRDAIEAGKFLELLFGGATERVGQERTDSFSPEQLEEELLQIEARRIAREEEASS